jgi:ribosome-binding factor A
MTSDKTRSGGSERSGDRKTLQLCRQVSRSLSYVLGGLGDDVLGGLFVESVAPAPNASHLLVTVSSQDAEATPETIITRLHAATPRLREEIASDINRRRVPELTFRCVRSGGEKAEGGETEEG